MTVMMTSTDDSMDELYATIVEVARQIAAIIESSSSGGVRTRRAEWTVAEMAAHLAHANEGMADIAACAEYPGLGDGTAPSIAAGLAESNRQALQAITERDLAVLASTIVAQAERFVAAAGRRATTDVVNTPLGTMPMSVFSAYILAHMLTHGTAISFAVGRPTIVRPRHVELVLPFLAVAYSRVVRPDRIRGVRLRCGIQLSAGPRFTVSIADGAVDVDDDAGPVDCMIWAEPVSYFLLTMGILRRGLPLIVAGKLRCGGHRPLAAMRFRRLFDVP
jgi:uncharacterized protein (TIGR03083 family)